MLDEAAPAARNWCIGARTQFGVERGDEMHALATRMWGNPCPCTVNLPCSILPAPLPDPEHHWEASVSTMDSVSLRSVS